jgi:hypothetical protein
MTNTSPPQRTRHLEALPEQKEGIVDNGRNSLADIPLGPWAGAEVTVYGSRTGSKWHGDPDCSSLRKVFRHESHRQPEEGSLADLNLPNAMHCAPVGELGTYRQEADELVQFAATTRKYATLEPESLDLSAHAALRVSPSSWRYRRQPPAEVLAPLWNRCRGERAEVADAVNEALRPNLSLMLAAAWILTGRDSHHRHEPGYEAFVSAIEEEFTSRTPTATFHIGSHAGRDAIPTWLNDVVAGRSPESATTVLADREAKEATRDEKNGPDGFVAAVRESWLRAGDTWSDILRGVALAHPGEVVALFRNHELATAIDWRLATLVEDLAPGAQINCDQFSWTAARVPALVVPFLAHRDRGLVGLTLQTEAAHAVKSEQCALFLRNLLTDLDAPDLAPFVHPTGPGTALQPDDQDLPVTALSWEYHAFGYGLGDGGITLDQCLPAFRAARLGHEIRPQKIRRSGRK